MKQYTVTLLRTLIVRLTILSNRLDPIPQDVMDAAWTLEEYLRTRPSVLPDQIVSALMEIGMPCDWVKDDTQ